MYTAFITRITPQELTVKVYCTDRQYSSPRMIHSYACGCALLSVFHAASQSKHGEKIQGRY